MAICLAAMREPGKLGSWPSTTMPVGTWVMNVVLL